MDASRAISRHGLVIVGLAMVFSGLIASDVALGVEEGSPWQAAVMSIASLVIAVLAIAAALRQSLQGRVYASLISVVAGTLLIAASIGGWASLPGWALVGWGVSVVAAGLTAATLWLSPYQ